MTKHKKGFTLIEILVVIAIIVILAGILYPVYSGVRNKAHQVKCALNLKQIGMAISMYAGDHDDMLPIGGYDSTVTGADGKQAIVRTDWEDELLNGYIKNSDILLCPTSPI